MSEDVLDPHAGGQLYSAGVPLAEATGAVVLLHGRGGSAEDILSLAPALGVSGTAYLAPQAEGNTWYPESFLAPREQNEPRLSSALRRVEAVLAMVAAAGIPLKRTVLGGFSQGACLTSEFVARHPARYGAVLAFTGGLIGPHVEAAEFAGDLAGTPVLLASGDPDPHVPWARVEETAAVLRAMHAEVTLQRYPGRPHTVSREEVATAREMLLAITG